MALVDTTQVDGGALTGATLKQIKADATAPSFVSVTTTGPVTASGAVTAGGGVVLPTQANITAHSGGGQANAVALVQGINQIATVAANGDSVRLPASAAGISVVVINNSANNANLFPASGDSIESGSANAAFNVPGGKTATFFSPAAGQPWGGVLSS